MRWQEHRYNWSTGRSERDKSPTRSREYRAYFQSEGVDGNGVGLRKRRHRESGQKEPTNTETGRSVSTSTKIPLSVSILTTKYFVDRVLYSFSSKSYLQNDLFTTFKFLNKDIKSIKFNRNMIFS